MPKAYSIDLRERVAGYVQAGHSCNAAAARFNVSVSFVVKLMRAFYDSGSLEPKPGGGRRHSKLDPHQRFLIGSIAKKPDITMRELATELATMGTSVAPASISRWFIRKGYSFKKNTAGQRTRST